MLGTRIGIDFGSANLTVFAEGKGVVLREPSVMVCDASSGKALAMGSAARRMLGKLPPSLYAVYPIKEGVVNDFEAARLMLSRYIDKICDGKLFRPSVLMCVPAAVSDIAKEALFEAVTASGAGRACFISEALAAAVGAGVGLTEPKGACICDIGGDITDIAVVTMGSIASSDSVRVGGNVLTQAIADHVLRRFQIEIGDAEAQRLKHTVGSAVLRESELAVTGYGKSCDTGLPVTFELTSADACRVLRPYLEQILAGLRHVLEETSPELCADLMDSGLILSGGTANLYGLEEYLSQATGLRVKKAPDPENCAAIGIGKLLKNMKYLERNGYYFAAASGEAELEED